MSVRKIAFGRDTALRCPLLLVGTSRCCVPGGKVAGIAPAWGADGAARRPYLKTMLLVGDIARGDDRSQNSLW